MRRPNSIPQYPPLPPPSISSSVPCLPAQVLEVSKYSRPILQLASVLCAVSHWSIGEADRGCICLHQIQWPIRCGLSRRPTSRRFFRKPAGWFGRDRVRKRLYAKGFPHPFERGLWSTKGGGRLAGDALAATPLAHPRGRRGKQAKRLLNASRPARASAATPTLL